MTMDTVMHDLNLLAPLLWPLLALAFVLVFYKPILELFNSVVLRVKRGDELHLSILTIGKSAGPLTIPSGANLVTDDHLALIHRSWRAPKHDARFPGQKMYQIHVILFGEPKVLDRVAYVYYRLDPSYPDPESYKCNRERQFELKELANGYSLLRAEVKIKGQDAIIHLSRFIDLTDASEHLAPKYLPLESMSESPC
jgi:hypothetical protein